MGTLLLVILDAMAGIPLGWLFLVATLAGLGYPLLFSGRRESAGPAVIRGTAYGFLCWIVAELTPAAAVGRQSPGLVAASIRSRSGPAAGISLSLIHI